MVEAHRLDAWLSKQNWDLSGSRHNSKLFKIVKEGTVLVWVRVFDMRVFKALCVSTYGWAKVMIMAFLVTMFTNRNSRDSLIIWGQGYVICSGSLLAGGSLLIRPVMCLGRLVRQRGTGRL